MQIKNDIPASVTAHVLMRRRILALVLRRKAKISLRPFYALRTIS
jgi:hypothetical protein